MSLKKQRLRKQKVNRTRILITICAHNFKGNRNHFENKMKTVDDFKKKQISDCEIKSELNRWIGRLTSNKVCWITNRVVPSAHSDRPDKQSCVRTGTVPVPWLYQTSCSTCDTSWKRASGLCLVTSRNCRAKQYNALVRLFRDSQFGAPDRNRSNFYVWPPCLQSFLATDSSNHCPVEKTTNVLIIIVAFFK